MGRNEIKIDASARAFIKKVKNEFRPSKIIFFGSRANGEFREYSDYDFIIVSDSFLDVHWLDRISKILRHWDSDRNIDVLPYTTDEFAHKKSNSSIVKEAVRKGISV
ncbi:nucleotidyltransferase domain-containing protein [Candidatus Woesearchaeota archaeon]|nr:nucleotidyltransferase domain-containing protein [Candidatus Woesearchaeota archaeon]